MTKYIGITIGPIDRIATYVKSSHSIWASSYIFSFLVKHIILHLKETCKIEDGNFITPVITNDMFEPSPVGRFSDQYVIQIEGEGEEADNKANRIIEETNKATNTILDDIAKDINEQIKKANINDIKEYLKRVIKVYVIEKYLTGEVSNVVRDFQNSFAAMECFDTYQQVESRNYLAEYFQSKTEPKTKLLVKDTNEDTNNEKGQAKNRMFSSILECSAQIEPEDLEKYENGNNDNNLKTFQKYIAFVAADGDNFGKTIAKLEEKSKYFTDFSSKLREAVASYGGQTIFQGGDDILFFAPTHNPDSELSKGNKATDVSTDGTSTHNPNNSSKKDDSEEKITDIFSLIKYIDDLFEEMVIKKLKEKDENGKCVWDGLKDKPSLSYGVAIAYYKHPMNEIRQRANDLLYKCKNDYNRNTIAWEVCKHSGQTFSGVIDKKEEKPEEKGQSVFAQMLSLISKSIPKPNLTKAGEDIDNNFLHSITHWIMSHKEIIESVILKNPQKEKLLENYFNNNFNEDSHKSKKEFIEAIREFLLIGNLKEPCANLHAILRYVELLINKSEHGK